ncbi:hypothetical protein HZB89_02545, partial [archaeon]|nr:hypothetical protein [archaeon]
MLKKFTSNYGVMLLRERLLRQHKTPATLVRRLERELTPRTLTPKYYDPSYMAHRIIPFGRNMMVYSKKISGNKLQAGESSARKEFEACAKLLLKKINAVRPLGIILSKGNE